MQGRIDLVGQRFSKWAVQDYARTNDNGQALWNVICDCGNTSVVYGFMLRNCRSTQCRRCSGKAFAIHGYARKTGVHSLYKTWRSIKQRCYGPNHKGYARYGGRGIRLHEPWRHNFAAFALYIENVLGKRPEGMTLDRVDNDGHYEPRNLRWATRSQQRRNQSKKALKMVA